MDNKISLGGWSVLRAWQPGAISCLLAQGLSLRQAQAVAQDAMLAEVRTHNLVTTVGMQLAGDLLTGGEMVGITYHAIGTSSTAPVVGNTQLGAEVARLTLGSRVRAGTVLTFSAYYIAAQCTYNIQEVGLFGGVAASSTANSGRLFARILQAYDNSAGSTDLTFDYNLEVTG